MADDLTANVEATSTLTTDFNVRPYYDDYDASKGYVRILYKPGFAVQARELTQQQVMLQKQIDRFGKHVFREGSIVLPGQFSIEKDVDYVKVMNNDDANTVIDINNFLNENIKGLTHDINAYVVEVANGDEADANTKTIFVRYQGSSAANTDIKTFQAGETLFSANAGTMVVHSTSPTGKGSRFVIREGVVFAKEHFIQFETQSIILDRYNTVPTCRVGFFISEDIITFLQDDTLLDPALESSNFAAPGADRLRLTPSLAVLDIDDQTGAPDFVELFTINEGIITELYDRSQYAILQDEMAKRTSDESGDYYVNGLSVRVRENLDTGTNGGYSNTGNTQLLSIGVEPGVAYVKGYEIGKLVTEYVTTEKSKTFSNVNAQIATATMGNYIRCDEFSGMVDLDTGATVTLYNQPSNRLSGKQWVATAPSGSAIGTARVAGIQYASGVPGSPTGVMDVYLYDIQMNTAASFSNTKSLFTSGFGADVVLDSANNAVLQETASATLLYAVGTPGIRTLRDGTGNPDMSFNFYRTTDVSLLAAGTLDLPLSTYPDEEFPYGTTTLAAADKREIIFTLNQAANISIPGSVTAANGSFTLTGNASAQFTRLNVGDKVEIAGKTDTWFVGAIANNTSLTTTTALPAGVNGNNIFKAFKAGDTIDLTGIGVTAGTTRSVTTTPSQLSFNLHEVFPSDISSTITYQVARPSAREITKNLRPNRYVKIDCSTAGTSGPFGLGFSDVYQVRKIIKKTSSYPTTESDGTDVTTSFAISNGQKDQFYDHGTITPLAPLVATDRLLVVLDYFEPSFTLGRGYFSVDSYPVDDTLTSNTTIRTETIPIFTSPTSKIDYDLRNFLDFRPVKAITATDATTIGTASVNPTTTAGLTFETNGLRLPVAASQFTFDYSYYLARRDLVVMDKNGTISIVVGTPGVSPVTPMTPENTMSLASIYVSPYPSIAPNYAQTLRRKDLSVLVRKTSNIRFTMRDIGVLKERIVNLEYYASLNALEKSAVDMQILDEDGLNRFKNGVFVDTFRDHSLGDITDPNYRIVVDPDEKSIRPIYTMGSTYYDFLSGTGVTRVGDLLMLDYTPVVLIDQPKVTSFRNLEVSSYRFIGKLTMSPDTDVWVDTDQIEDNAVTIGPDGTSLPQSTATEWNAWQKKVVGYNLYKESTGELLARFDANEKDLAYNNAYWLARNADFNRNTIGLTSSGSSNSGAKFETVVETVYENTRTGTETFLGVNEATESLGNRVVDVSLVPYIRSQTIKCLARGVKANTKLFVFFDGEAMSTYVTPMTVDEYTTGWPTTGTAASEGDVLTSDTAGNVYFLLRLPPEKQFRVGTKEVVVIDSPTNSEDDATTIATGYFVAAGLVQQKQNNILTTRTVVQLQKDVSDTKTSATQFVQQLRASCSAYSFLPKAPDGEEGVFMTGVDIYLAAKHPTLGIWVEIREMDASGGITRNQVPFSEVWFESDELVISDDASVPQEITFPSPVFLYNNIQYAFIIHTVGLNPDTYVWVSRLGENDINTGNQVSKRPLTGTFYTTNNNLNWDIVPDIDLYCTFYRASFTKDTTSTAIIGNKPIEQLVLGNVSSSLTNYGEGFVGNYRMTLTGNTGSIAVSQLLIGANSGANSAVLAVNGSEFTVANTLFIPGERANVANANGMSAGISTVISSIKSATGVISKYKADRSNITAEMLSSNGFFYVGDTIHGVQSGSSATVDGIRNFRYSVLDFEPSYLKFNKTPVAFEMQATSNTGVIGSYARINENDNYYYSTEQAIFSRSNEITSLGGGRSSNVRVTMATSTEFLSPVIDLGRTHSVYVDNIINANTYNEDASTAGYLTNKYISAPVTLADGQDAEDVLVILTAYRPPTTDVLVWFKMLHGEDGTAFDDRPWTALEKVDDTAYSSAANPNDFREFSYRFPEAMMNSDGVVQYTQGSITYTGYKYFAIKIGLSGTNAAMVPRVADTRVICLQA